MEGDIIFAGNTRTRRFTNPARVMRATQPAEVRSALEEADAAVRGGMYAAGFIAYEAAPAFDPALAVNEPVAGLPLLWVALYESCQVAAGTPSSGRIPRDLAWTPLVDRPSYDGAIERIREYIAAGATYQVNYTWPLRCEFEGDPRPWFDALWTAQRPAYAAYVDSGNHIILSASPELFFRLNGGTITTRPMKGTRARGLWPEQDRRNAHGLRASEKDQAENLMIVDLLRNDIGRVAEPGTVNVPRLFDIERYETVWQMTSTITAHTNSRVPEIIRALFPCGSVTGAPKVRTMQIIRELESHPRGVYCGSVGWWAPDGDAEFNVAIRTVTIDRRKGTATYNTGGGITWDSSAGSEFDECVAKTAVLRTARPEFHLLESLLWDGLRLHLLEYHLERLRESAEYFGFAFPEATIRRSLTDAVTDRREGRWKVRLVLERDGKHTVDVAGAGPVRSVRLGFAPRPVDRGNVFLYHKTTHRTLYEKAKASRPDCDDVLLFNQDGEVTESCIANVVLDMDGERLTPPVSSGLLAGTFRRELLERGEIHVARLSRQDLCRAKRIWLINSVRGWMPVEWIALGG
jgi:para-aminobenzoate synthetase/4-amino-4-deoxychorismate lyase